MVDDLFGIDIMTGDFGGKGDDKSSIKKNTTSEGDQTLDEITANGGAPEKIFDVHFYFNSLDEPTELIHQVKCRTHGMITNEKAKSLMFAHKDFQMHRNNPRMIVINYIQEVG